MANKLTIVFEVGEVAFTNFGRIFAYLTFVLLAK
jgi:hypothetical protein